jgi:hypothetical protein
MPTVLSKLDQNQPQQPPTTNCHANGAHKDGKCSHILEKLDVPSKCTKCCISCDVCAIRCGCERCMWRRRLQPCCIDAARIAIVQTQTKLAYQDPKRKKKVVYEAVKNCIVKVTKKGSYKKAFHIGDGADKVRCCKAGFDSTYGINHTYVDELIAYMKKKVCRIYFLTIYHAPTNINCRQSSWIETLVMVNPLESTSTSWRTWPKYSTLISVSSNELRCCCPIQQSARFAIRG